MSDGVADGDLRSLATSLLPSLAEACGERLTNVNWFKADWQRGGAATGTASYDHDGGRAEVVVKIPVVRRELTWLQRLQDGETPVVPRLYAAGVEIGGYDLAWAVMERFAHGPLGLHWHDQHVPRVAEAAARFHAAAGRYDVDEPPRDEPWEALLRDAMESIRINQVENERGWTESLKRLGPRLSALVEEWNARDVGGWLHGDLHLANAMSRTGIDDGAVCLIDLAEVHSGHWLEDAVFLERQLWARPERLKRHKPVRAIAAARRTLGLPVEADYPRLAMIRRLLLAATAPRFIRSEGHPAHLAACLRRVKSALDELK
ncbi:MAG: phosphotransferase [Phycisphaerales bacterium]|nr:phosphotransferase [Phycisphaerales bacterium]